MVNRLIGYATDLLRFLNPRNNRLNFRNLGYDRIIDSSEISVFAPRRGKRSIVSILDNIIVKASLSRNPYAFDLYPDGCHRIIKYHIKLNGKNFPGLLPQSKIENIVLLKYMRRINATTRIKSWRLVVFTDQGQIYHNFPAKLDNLDGAFDIDDIVKFEESVIWDCEGRRFPSTNKNCQEYEQYIPNLPEECYQHHPPISENKFSDHKIINNHGKKIVLSRFYFPSRCHRTNPFVYMGGFVNDYHMTVIGTYQSNINIGARQCVFFSDDGGREWFNRYEFGDCGEYEYVHNQRGYNISNWGNSVKIFAPKNEVVDLQCAKRRIDLNFNSKTRKFIWENKIEIKKLFCTNTLTIETKTQHNYSDGDVVSIVGRIDEDDLEWIISPQLDELSCAEVKLFKVKVINDFSFELYEFVANPNNNICCRHIHHINRLKDGWIIGTGEIFPNGWLIYIQQKECDYFNYNACNARADFKIFRLTSNTNSVQRTIGCEFINDSKIIFASDHPTLDRPFIKMGKNEISRSSTGVYTGDVADIDDFSKFRCIYESTEVGYFFRKINGILVYGGQLGEVAISFNNGLTWNTYHINQTLRCFEGAFVDGFSIDGIIFQKK